MKKFVPYIIVGIIVTGLVILLFANRQPPVRKLDERITLREKDKIPYGFHVAMRFLPKLFPNALISTDKSEPGFWDALSTTESNQVVILSAIRFNADEDELNRLLRFVKNGNYVFIIAEDLSYDARDFFSLSNGDYYVNREDSIEVALQNPPFKDSKSFSYPGRKFESFFTSLDTSRTIVLGRTPQGYPNFIQLKAGKGSVFIHLSPLAFSNYFILHKNNVAYYQQAMSVIPNDVTHIVWDEYYLSKKTQQDKKEPNMLGVLMRYPAFKWALLTAIFALLLFVLMEMRRRQRQIPVWEKPKNDSLDFVKTIGRLYHDRSDHHNLAWKMGIYFLEHVRTHYKLSTAVLDEDFITSLHAKSGLPIEQLTDIVNHIKIIQSTGVTTEQQLALFHKQLESFYQNT